MCMLMLMLIRVGKRRRYRRVGWVEYCYFWFDSSKSKRGDLIRLFYLDKGQVRDVGTPNIYWLF